MVGGIIEKIIVYVTILIVLLKGCLVNGEISLPPDSEDKTIYNMAVEAIELKDKEKMKELFSERALEECSDLDEKIDCLFDFIEGEYIGSQYVQQNESSHREKGKSRYIIDLWCDVHTTEGRYGVYLNYYSKDEINPKNEGVYMIMVYRGKDEEQYKSYGQKNKCAGAYTSESLEKELLGDDIGLTGDDQPFEQIKSS